MHIRFYLLLILALSLAIPACKSTQNSTSKGATSNPDELDYATKRRIEALYVEACTYMIRGEYEKASEGFREVLKSDPVNHAAMYNIAKLGIEQRNFNEAIEYGKAALKLEKDNFWYYQMLSQAYEGKGDFENATLIQEQALERFPQRNEERLRLARLYARSQQYDEALRQLNTIEQQLGPNPETLAEKLRLFLRTDRQAEAIGVIEQLIALDPQNERYLELRFQTLTAIGREEEAIQSLRDMLESDPNNGFALLNLAEYYKDQGDFKKSDEYLFQAFRQPSVLVEEKIRITQGMMAYLEKEPEIMPRVKTLVSLLEAYHPTTGAVYALKGNLFDFQTQNDSAQANYRKSLALDGSNQQVWMALLLSDLEEGDNASLKQDAEGAMEFYPNQSEFLFFFGTASQNLKEYEEAIYAFEKIRKIGNAREEIRSQALMALGGIYHDQQQHSKSDARLQEALRLDPKNALALNNYAYFLAQRGERLDEAEKMIAQATALQPGTASFEDTYAWVLYKKGDYEAALMWQEKALKHGQGAELHEHHGDILSKLGQKDKALKAWQKAIEMGATFDLNEKNSQP